MIKKNKPIKIFINHYKDELNSALESLDISKIEQASKIITRAFMINKQVFIIGNGGSASLSSHMACDLGKGTLSRVYAKNEKRLKVMSLTDNVSLLTAFGNDLSFDHLFVQQLKNLIEKKDVLIVISGSGNSKNIIKAVNYAKEQGAITIGFLGFGTGGIVAELVDCPIIVKSNHYGPIEDVHLILNHILTSWFAKIKRDLDGVKKIKNNSTPFRKD